MTLWLLEVTRPRSVVDPERPLTAGLWLVRSSRVGLRPDYLFLPLSPPLRLQRAPAVAQTAHLRVTPHGTRNGPAPGRRQKP